MVLVIIGITVTFAVLSLSSLGRNPPAQDTAGKLADLSSLVAEQAVMQSREYGLRIEPHAYQILSFDGHAWNEPKDDPLYTRHEVDDVTLTLELEGEPVTLAPAPTTAAASSASTGAQEPALKPQVLLLSSGEITPFLIHVVGTDKGAIYAVKGTLTEGICMLEPGKQDCKD